MQRAKLLKLAAYLENLPRRKFNIGMWVEEKPKCGTVACAFGWCPVIFPRSGLKHVKRDGWDTWGGDIEYTNSKGTFEGLEAAEQFFGISEWVAKNLFLGNYYPEYHGYNKNGERLEEKGITPKRVARRIRTYVETGEIK